MATRVKYIQTTTTLNGANSTNLSGDNTPSTAGDIVTRVIVDRISVQPDNNVLNNSRFYLRIGGRLAVAYQNSQDPGNTVVFAGSDTNNNTANQYGLSGWLSGVGALPTGAYFVPSSFYCKVGEILTAQFIKDDGSGGSMNSIVIVSLVCIGEY